MIQLFVLALGSPFCFSRDLRDPWDPGGRRSEITLGLNLISKKLLFLSRHSPFLHLHQNDEEKERGCALCGAGPRGSVRRDEKVEDQPSQALETGSQLTDRPLRWYGWKLQNLELESVSNQRLSASSQTSIRSGVIDKNSQWCTPLFTWKLVYFSFFTFKNCLLLNNFV